MNFRLLQSGGLSDALIFYLLVVLAASFWCSRKYLPSLEPDIARCVACMCVIGHSHSLIPCVRLLQVTYGKTFANLSLLSSI